MTSNKVKCQMQHLSVNDPMQQYRFGKELLDSCLSEEDWGMLIISWINMSQQCTEVAKKVSAVLVCIINTVSNRTREVIVPLYTVMARLQLRCCIQFSASDYMKDIELLRCVQRIVTKLLRRLENKT